MNITKIKRILAKCRIGNPLNMLFYNENEIREMKNRGIFKDYEKRKKQIRQQRQKPYIFRERNKGLWGIQVGKIIVHKTFKDKEQAEKWGKWNYKGYGGYKVVLL